MKMEEPTISINANKINNAKAALLDLSKREKEILILLMQGKNSRQIGETLFISKLTVDVHRKSILRKTGSTSTVELTMKVMQQTFGLSAFTLSVL
jgi:DNA-binding CsgD family transcriptional regulator